MENLPAEIILVIFRSIYSRDEIDHIRNLTRIGTVNRYIYQVELKFWKQRLINRNGSRLAGVLRKFNSPKLTYLQHYFGCLTCDQLATHRCKRCSDIACSDCYVDYSACECIKYDGIDRHKDEYKCRSHKRTRCYQCTAPLCSDCFKMCWMCQMIYCSECIYVDNEPPGDHCGSCYAPADVMEIGEKMVPYALKLPFEILVDIFQLVFRDRSIPLIDRVKQINRLGATNQVLRSVERTFWDCLTNETLSKLQPKYYLDQSERPNVFLLLDIPNLPNHLRDNPKEMYLYSKFSCQQCGQKAILTECKKCRMFVCNFCGHNRQCHCTEFIDSEDFLCYYCHYRCHSCQRDLCFSCIGLCRYCRLFFCRDCHVKNHDTCRRAALVPYGDWQYISAIESSDSDSDSEDYSDSEDISYSDGVIGTCIKCEEDIYEEEDLGNCSLCEYYNEINEYQLCRNCIDTCQICHEEYCTNCMILYHEPCEQWKMCPSCKSEVSSLHQCEGCGSDSCCEFCIHICNVCSKTKCEGCLVECKNNNNNGWTCTGCTNTTRPDPMQIEHTSN